eukprot:CAMPEP_0113482540 /NCGR_PEP_ID=MMETSP0014_2-20120614/22972_1 /TAXON_ID=2857 /ORGANISM="Nitzschia sp." /LENGTH=523 /DNA_ID=CAMNT_0000376061 /DNA_START=329 /DNA_END=1900 /DNA_ORIENTATION=- /assembly_acc=CAM_ASM_000159
MSPQDPSTKSPTSGPRPRPIVKSSSSSSLQMEMLMAASQQQQQQEQDKSRNSRQKKDPPGWNSSTHLSVKSDKDNLANNSNNNKKDDDDTLNVVGIVVGGDKPSSKNNDGNESQEDSYPLLSSVGIDSRSSDDDEDDDTDDSDSELDCSDFDSSDDDEEEDYHASMKMLEEMMMDEEHRRRSRSVSSMPELTSSKSNISMTAATRKEGTKIQSRKQHRQEAVSDGSNKKGMASSDADLLAALAKFELRRAGSDKCLQDLTWNDPSSNVQVRSSLKKRSGGIHSSGSSNSLGDLLQTKPSAKSLVANSGKGKSKSSTSKSPPSDSDLLKPEDCLQAILNKSSSDSRYEPVGAGTAPEGFFVPLTKKDFDDFSNDISAAVRTGDIKFLKKHLKSGKSPHCCNKFKESIVHTICRRGNEELLSCILKYEQWQDQGEEEEGTPPTSLRVVDDQNRTCLHDAAWTHKPNFRLVKILVDAFPDLLLVKDQRGFTPLAYVGRNQYSAWNAFLHENKDLLTPKLLSPFKAA